MVFVISAQATNSMTSQYQGLIEGMYVSSANGEILDATKIRVTLAQTNGEPLAICQIHSPMLSEVSTQCTN